MSAESVPVNALRPILQLVWSIHALTPLPATTMSGADVYVPSLTKKGPLHARDIEQARMPCYLGLDYPDDSTQPTPDIQSSTYINLIKIQTATSQTPARSASMT